MTQSARPSHPLIVKGVRVEYESIVAVDHADLTIESGMILGLLGPNGAGKTSLMNAIVGLVEATYGEVYICGYSLQDDRAQALSSVGFQPDIPPIYEDLTVGEFLTLFASAYGLPVEVRAGRVDEVLKVVGLLESKDALAGGLSRGMRQRVFLAKTLIPDPQLLILDEPASGLDPIARHEFVHLLRQLAERGKAIVLSSHILEELNTVCDALCVMSKGIILDQGRLGEVRERIAPPTEIVLRLLNGPSPAIQSWLEREFIKENKVLSALRETAEGYDLSLYRESSRDVTLKTPDDEAQDQARTCATLLKSIVDAGHSPTHFQVKEASLQDLFLKLSREKT
jgi:ABC-2 type transport system ATP-binding protein